MTDRTLPLVLMAVASVGLGVWDLLKKEAKDVLLTVTLAEGALLAGTGLEAILPGGFLVGAVVAAALGVRGIERINRQREAELDRALLALPDRAGALLVLHDHADARRAEGGGLGKAAHALSFAFVTLLGVGLIAAGLTYDLWQALLTGIGTLFLPATWALERVTAAEERGRIEARIAAAEEAQDRLPSGGG